MNRRSSNKTDFLRLFYHNFESFLTDVKLVYPEDRDMIERYESVQVDLLKKLDIYKIPELIVKFTKPYEKEIETQNESFFLKMDFSKSNTRDFLYIVKKIKESCDNGTVSVENKIKIFKYLEVLLILGEKALEEGGRV
jgi:hypothetical protein